MPARLGDDMSQAQWLGSDIMTAFRAIRSMLATVWSVAEPHAWQLAAIRSLLHANARALLVRKTGAGKSIVALGAATLLTAEGGGVCIFVVPLIGARYPLILVLSVL